MPEKPPESHNENEEAILPWADLSGWVNVKLTFRGRKKHKTTFSLLDSKNHTKAKEKARRRRQIEKGMLKAEGD